MSNPNPPKPDPHASRELSDQELALRLQKLESELEPPVSATVKHDRPEGALTQAARRWLQVAKFVGVVMVAGIVTVVVWRVATFLTTFVIVGVVAWVLYKLFWEPDRPKR